MQRKKVLIALEKLERKKESEDFELIKHKVLKEAHSEQIDKGPKPQYLDQQGDKITRKQARDKDGSDSEESLSERSEPSFK